MAEEYKTGTLKDIAIGLAEKQDHMVNTLTEEAPIAAMLKFEAATHGMWNAYEEVTKISTPDSVDMDQPLPTLAADTNLRKTDLQIIGGLMEAGEDKLQVIGKEQYFAKRLPLHLKAAGQMMERKIIYDNIRNYALEKGKVIDAGGSGDNCFSIIAYREIEGENIGLYNAKGFGSGTGKLLDVKAVNGGDLYKDEKGVLVYGMRLKGYIGYQLANPNGVCAIVNIDPENIQDVLAKHIDKAILEARADSSARGMLMMHPAMLSLLNRFKSDQLSTSVTDKDIDRTFKAWNGVRVATSYNFNNGTEKHITL